MTRPEQDGATESPSIRAAAQASQTSSLFGGMEVTRVGSNVTVKQKHPPTPEMQAVLDSVRRGERSAVVEATAGSGKTTLLQMIAELLIDLREVGPDKPAAVISFNTRTTKDLRKVMPVEMEVSTIHAMGLRIIKEQLGSQGDVTYDKGKYKRLIQQAIADRAYAPGTQRQMRELLSKSQNLTMANTIEMDFRDDWLDIMHQFEVNVTGVEDDLYSLTKQVITQGCEELLKYRTYDFADQLYAPYLYSWSLDDPFHRVLIDEVQDLSRSQTNILMSILRPEAKVYGVGDEAQSIYGFNGANHASLSELTEILEAERFPLSVCFRCPKRHVAFASPYTNDIQPAPGAREGTLDDVNTDEFIKMVKAGDMVLCRTNAPLVQVCYRLARYGKPAFIAGKDVARAIIGYAAEAITWDGRQSNTENLDDSATLGDTFIPQVVAHTAREKKKVQDHADRTGDDPANDLVALDDKLEALRMIVKEGLPVYVKDLKDQIKDLFKASKKSITLMTVHAAKGAEADTVYLIAPELMPHPSAKTAQAIRSEEATIFVSRTRARKELYLVHGDETPVDNIVPDELRGRDRPTMPQRRDHNG